MAFPHNAFTETVGATGMVPYYKTRSGFKQTKPIDRSLQLSYSMRMATSLNRGVTFVAAGDTYTKLETSANGQPSLLADWNQIDAIFPRSVTATKNKCYDKFVDTISDRASLGETLAELGKSSEMILGRTMQILRFTRHLKRGNLPEAWKELTQDVGRPMPKKYGQSKTFSGRFLEAHLGWEPLIKDIYSSVDVLQSPIDNHRVRASVSAPFEGHLSTPSHTWKPGTNYPMPYSGRTYSKTKGRISVLMGANVAVNNPNLWLANQLGLINPVQVLWAVTPFSMIADWFVNVSQVLNSYTDFIGLSVSGGYHTITVKGSIEKFNSRYFRWYNGTAYVTGGGIQEDTQCTFKGMVRTPGLATPSLILQPYKVPSLMRAATAVSLLVGALPRK